MNQHDGDALEPGGAGRSGPRRPPTGTARPVGSGDRDPGAAPAPPEPIDPVEEPLEPEWQAEATDDEMFDPTLDEIDDEWTEDDTPWTMGRIAALVVAVIAVSLVGYAIGYSRGSAGVDQGSSATTSIVKSAGGGSTQDTSATSGAPATALAVPAVTPTVVNFDQGIPLDVDGRPVQTRGDWTTVDGAATPREAGQVPDDAADPPLMGPGPDLLVEPGAPPKVASVKLVTPTAFSGLVTHYVDDRNYWAATPDAKLTHVTLYEVKDGTQQSRGFVDVGVAPGTVIGMIEVDGMVTLTINGESKVLSTFFGAKAGIPIEGNLGIKVGLITGAGTPAFDDLSYG